MAQYALISLSRRSGGPCLSERWLAAIDHLMTDLVGFQDTHRVFEPKDLLDALPVFANPVDFDQD